PRRPARGWGDRASRRPGPRGGSGVAVPASVPGRDAAPSPPPVGPAAGRSPGRRGQSRRGPAAARLGTAPGGSLPGARKSTRGRGPLFPLSPPAERGIALLLPSPLRGKGVPLFLPSPPNRGRGVGVEGLD